MDCCDIDDFVKCMAGGVEYFASHQCHVTLCDPQNQCKIDTL